MKLSEQIARHRLSVAFWSTQQTGGLSSVDLAASSDGSSVTLTASDGSVAPVAGANASMAGVMTAADKVKLDGLSPATVRDFGTFSEIAGTAIGAAITHLPTAGRAARGDGGDGLYVRVTTEPFHAGKVQSADGTWWELVPLNGEWTAEQFGAKGDGVTDDRASFVDALSASAALGVTLVARGGYLLSDTLTFPNGRYGFKGPDYRDLNSTGNVGFIWGGGSDKPIIEVHRWLDSRVESLVVTNRSNLATQATGVTGILFHNEAAGAASIQNSHFEFLGVFGCHIGVQIGDYTKDGYDSNWEQNVIENLHCMDCANALIIDSHHQDNIIIKTFHNGGSIPLPAYVGTRNHVIWIKRSGHAHHFDYIFARLDSIVPDNAAVRIDDGTFSCGTLSFEGAEMCRLLDVNSTALSRSQNLVQLLTGTDSHKDSSGRSMILAARSGVTLLNCTIPGDIQCDYPVTAINTLFRSPAGFTGSALDELVAIGTKYRSGEGTTIIDNSTRIQHGAIPIFRESRFNTGAVNASVVEAVAAQTIGAGELHVWQVCLESVNALQNVYRLFIWRNQAGAISHKLITDVQSVSGTVFTVDDNGGNYDINIENTLANNQFFSGWLETRDKFTI